MARFGSTGTVATACSSGESNYYMLAFGRSICKYATTDNAMDAVPKSRSMIANYAIRKCEPKSSTGQKVAHLPCTAGNPDLIVMRRKLLVEVAPHLRRRG